jgi:ABC-2 type transport system ATP-binding protein
MRNTIDVRGLRKRYGRVIAVDGLTFRVEPGQVTGFVGPNGAGKSTTMRVILGLDAPDSGTALVGGRPYRTLQTPLREVGALLDAGAVHPGRRARDHLRWLAHSNGLPTRRVDEVLDLVGLTSVARRRAGRFSLGMRQRLGIAAALLGDPPILMFDEPVNGLDPEGVYWIRGFLRRLAAEGRAVLVSSHLMSELEDTADHLVVVGRGRLIADTTVRQMRAAASDGRVLVRTPAAAEATTVLVAAGGSVRTVEPGELAVAGLPADRLVGLLAEHRVPITEVTAHRPSLEQAYLALTAQAVEFGSPTTES